MLRGALQIRGRVPASWFPASQITLCRRLSQAALKEETTTTAKAKDKILYEGGQPMTIRMMLASGAFNACYWSYYTLGSIFYKGVAIKGVVLFGDPLWGGLGVILTCVLFYFTRQYAHHNIKTCYLTADGSRIGFQCFNILSLPGRRLETSPLNIKVLKTSASAHLPISIKGLELNLLLDTRGHFYDTNLLKILNGSQQVPKFDPVEMKTRRIAGFSGFRKKSKT